MAMTSCVKLLAVPGPPPGPCEAKAGPAHDRQTTIDGAAKAKRDIRCLMRGDAMTISGGEKLSEVRATTCAGFENVARKCCCAKREPVCAICIHLYDAAIHSTFTSSTLALQSALWRCGRYHHRTAPA